MNIVPARLAENDRLQLLLIGPRHFLVANGAISFHDFLRDSLGVLVLARDLLETMPHLLTCKHGHVDGRFLQKLSEFGREQGLLPDARVVGGELQNAKHDEEDVFTSVTTGEIRASARGLELKGNGVDITGSTEDGKLAEGIDENTIDEVESMAESAIDSLTDGGGGVRDEGSQAIVVVAVGKKLGGAFASASSRAGACFCCCFFFFFRPCLFPSPHSVVFFIPSSLKN